MPVGGARPGAGRKAYRPTDADRAAVRTRTGLGQTQDAIGRFLGISVTTLARHFRDELTRGQDDANVQVARSIFDAATGRELQDDGTYKRVPPNPTLAIWWSKTRMGWKEPPRDDPALAVTVDTDAKATVRFYMPSNGRDEPDTDDEPPLIEGEA